MVQREGLRNSGKFKGRRCHPVRVTVEHHENLVSDEECPCMCVCTMPADKSARLLLIGGGVGSAPLYYLAEQLKKNGNDFVIFIGARAAKDLYRRDAYEALGRVEYTTEDGSLGEKGYVTNHSVLAEKFDGIFTCGPKPMMLAVAKYARENNIACEVSLENKMACGLGACLCCVEDTKEGHKCVCTDGPVFSIDELKW